MKEGNLALTTECQQATVHFSTVCFILDLHKKDKDGLVVD